jgi:hypothetical protein
MLDSGHAPCNDPGELRRFKLVARPEWDHPLLLWL